jgi:hypothetical protein
MAVQNPITRRTVLRGLGVSLALPWLDTFRPDALWAKELAQAGLAADGSPRRMAFIFVPNGVNLNEWTPRTEGFGYDLPYTLQPLARVQQDVMVLSGLTHDKGRNNGDGPGDHARSASVFLTGAQPRKTAGANIRSGISVDQAAAQAIGKQTRFASLELGCEGGRGAGSCDSGYSCAYSNNISWSGEATPMGKETNPREVFERLFSQDKQDSKVSLARRQQFKKSVLDFIADDAQKLQGKLGVSDNRKLDEYLTGVREIERRVERAEREPMEDGPSYQVPTGIPRAYAEHIRLMCDMMVLAFQTDSTRIASFMFANAGSNRNYREIDVPDGHHELSHHGGDPGKLDKIRRINRFHVAQLAYLLEKLKSIPEGDGTLLDNSMVCYGSALSDGNRHNNENLPILLAGGGGGAIDPGRHVRYQEETPMCNLFMSMLDSVGASVPYIGDSTGRLAGLKVG